MELLAAVDVRGGGAVRLVQGDFEREQGYGDPVELAQRFVDQGARWLHVVDLDAALHGEPVNRAVVEAIVAAVGIPVQIGGGIRTEDDVARLLDGGATRVVLGTSALDDPQMARRCAEHHPGAVAVGVDYRRRGDGVLEPAARGWVQRSQGSVPGLLDELDGAPLAALVATAIERDGTLAGPDVHGLVTIMDSTTAPVIASGGVGSLEDLDELRRLRSGDGRRSLAGVVVGRALVDGRISLREGIAACAQFG